MAITTRCFIPPEGCRFQERCPHVFEACKKPPELLEPTPGQQVRCWRYHPDHRARLPQPAPPGGTPAPVRPGPLPSAQPILSVRDLKVHFRARSGFFSSTAVKALDGVSLELARGETLAVVGESGSGKTTLGRATLRLLRPTSGQILFDGQDIAQLPEKGLKAFRRRAQAIFQDPYAALSPYMSVRQIVEEPLLVHGGLGPHEREAKVLEALAQVRLSPAAEFAVKFPHQLSGGQRQRVGIARTLVLSPEYVVADEPVSMIDASSRAEILYLLKEIQRARGLSFLYITHDLASSRHFADRIAVLYLGRVVEVAPAVTLIDRPHHPYTRALLEAVPEPDPKNRLERRAVVQGEPPNPARVPPGCAFHPRCPVAIRGKCERVEPELLEVAPGHWVACHLFPAPAADNARQAE